MESGESGEFNVRHAVQEELVKKSVIVKIKGGLLRLLEQREN